MLACLLAACGTGGGEGRSARTGAGPEAAGAPGRSGTKASSPIAPPSTVPATTTTPAPPVPTPGWSAAVTTPEAVTVEKRSVAVNGANVTLVRFKAGTYRLRLHTGSQDPGGAAALPADGGSSVSAGERPHLVGAFNGGFKVSTGSGGVEIDGHVLSPVEPGRASVVIDAAGAARVGVYGQTVPAPGDPAVSVRQNLGLLIADGAVSPTVGNVPSWGATVGGRYSVARSALGQTASGDLVVAASMACLPGDIASAMAQSGVETAMELDINPTWVQLDLAAAPGGSLGSVLPGQWRPADQYLSGWTRDFFTVLSS